MPSDSPELDEIFDHLHRPQSRDLPTTDLLPPSPPSAGMGTHQEVGMKKSNIIRDIRLVESVPGMAASRRDELLGSHPSWMETARSGSTSNSSNRTELPGHSTSESGLPQLDPTVQRYEYQSLPNSPTAFRLLRLLPGRRGDHLHIQLQDAELGCAPRYAAISYAMHLSERRKRAHLARSPDTVSRSVLGSRGAAV